MTQKNSSADSSIKMIFLLKNGAFLILLLFLFKFCFANTYDWIYGDYHYKQKLENLLKNGKTVIADFDTIYISKQTKIGSNYSSSFEFNYTYKVKDKTYSDILYTSESIPENSERLIKYMTVHYLPDEPKVHEIDAELEYEFAKEKIKEHSIFKLVFNCIGLLLSFILILYIIIIIIEKIKHFNEPIENPYKKKILLLKK